MPKAPSLPPKTLANLFFEPSTRTRCAFECAATQLGWHTLNFPVDTSAALKGESYEDTLLTLAQMPIDALAIRHSENHAAQRAAELIGDKVHIINAGDGTNEHPTQSLTNMTAILEEGLDYKHMTIAIVGDIEHSRVARSDLHALGILAPKAIHLICPKKLLPDDIDPSLPITHFDNLAKGLENVDVILVLRMQKERMRDTLLMSLEDYSQDFCLTPEALAIAKPSAIILHPGPVNHDFEISSSLVHCPQSRILHQVHCGVAVRMAVLYTLSGNTL